MTKERFGKILNAIKEAHNLQDKIDELMIEARDNIENDFMNSAGLMISHESIVISLLEEIMCDRYENISWWIYETKYGAKTPHIYDAETHELLYNLDTSDKLYDYLIECRNLEDDDVHNI